ncbi:MAG: hypothetical protein R3D53_00480 [Paracoccaceae bacterium]
MRYASLSALLLAASFGAVPGAAQAATKTDSDDMSVLDCAPLHGGHEGLGRTVCADVVALDQALVYNRFGSFNPFGMIFALRRDVVPMTVAPTAINADDCDAMLGTESLDAPLEAGAVRLKDCKRPRPLTLRANVGDLLHIRVTNLLRPGQPGFSQTFCRMPAAHPGALFQTLRDWVSWGDSAEVQHGEAACDTAQAAQPAQDVDGTDPLSADGDWPRTRGVSFSLQGLTPVGRTADAMPDMRCTGFGALAPGEAVDCFYAVKREGPYFMASNAAPSGGEGGGGSITHGLFGAVVAEPGGTQWYRSQLTRAAFAHAWQLTRTADGRLDAVENAQDLAAYEAAQDGIPILNMLRDAGAGAYELVHSDLNAIVHRPPEGTREGVIFREFSVFFHDELKTFVTRNFEELNDFAEGQLAGVRDGFAINYGASGMGAMLLANRKGIGPAADCIECLYEEFFLTSWANGDPALLEQFSDDPSNVHHSYLNDPVVFRNFHAGPKETHVFHLHAHQWFSGNDANRGAYLDSQTVAPQQGFTYRIYGGGAELYRRGTDGAQGWYDTLGAGNRNRTVGDSIFHCHLYPHFAQGMWELWRVHDVLEDGSRKLPDGQHEPALSLAEMSAETRAMKRSGSVDPQSGAWIAPAEGSASALGTPIPAVVPLPGQPWPILPSYGNVPEIAGTEPESLDAMPGYPFYVAGRPGHRPPQAPMDLARNVDPTGEDGFLDGGLPRHVVAGGTRVFPFSVPELPAVPDAGAMSEARNGGQKTPREKQLSQIVAKALALGDMTMHPEELELELLPYDGTALERAAMAFHAGAAGPNLAQPDGTPSVFDRLLGGYASAGGVFAVNGAPPKPGAPFADPCGAPDSLATLTEEADGYSHQGRPVFFAAADTDPAGIPEAERVRATPREVSNWVRKLLPSEADRPILYTVNSGVTEPLSGPVLLHEADPFVTGTDLPASFTSDPGVIGYRRYAASAVQLDLVTNRAGWHDPQARINVLTAVSDSYKEGTGRISPRISAGEEPFFFRALSGECIEFRHTNELPKDLELDDFQVRTPTDTIGQHIHLVKFDVTSSDGSGNGFNYEDGTLAADEIAARICAAKEAGMTTNPARAPFALELREVAGLCTEVTDPESGTTHWVVSDGFKEIWRRPRGADPRLFQTTVQRWFADPILSATRADGDGTGGQADRTLKTVFSHDHFGPSSIQQHGFYTALVIEPQRSQTCPDRGDGACTAQRNDRALVVAGAGDVGARKVILDPDAIDGDDRSYREFALAVADFATLYDPRDKTTPAALEAALSGGTGSETTLKGMATLACELRHAGDPQALKSVCGAAVEVGAATSHGLAGNLPPAWLAAGRPGDLAAHRDGLIPDLVTAAEAAALEQHLLAYRQKAAGFAPAPTAPLARPIAAPQRPESISVDHHDPYLVNYRGAPIPLRIGEGLSEGEDCALRPLEHWVEGLAQGVEEHCSVHRQRAGAQGDMANVFLSALHGDPETPVLESLSGDKVQFRLIQGAQEVQHSFTLEGFTWPRHVDQAFAAAMPPLEDVSSGNTLTQACEGLAAARAGRPDQYSTWLRHGFGPGGVGVADAPFWHRHEAFLAECFNAEGRIAAQEVGISEHFEFKSAFRQDITIERALRPPQATAPQDGPSDTLLHFGSVDALWNGAWGLFRVHAGRMAALARTEQACAAEAGEDSAARAACVAARKIPTLDEVAARAGIARTGGGAEAASPTPAREPVNIVAGCDYRAPVVHAAAVAIEVAAVFSPFPETGATGTPYAPGLFDRNGLFLALVDPRTLIAPGAEAGVSPAMLEDPASWQNIPLSRVRAAVRAAYARPEPFVLPVNAGDCVKLAVLNALRDTGEGRSTGLLDDLGDAPMPKIVPLNIEPDWSGPEGEGNQPATFVQQDAANVRPSARFALVLPLPVLNHRQSVAMPFGANATWALAGIGLAAGPDAPLSLVPDAPDAPRSGQIDLLSFYAGRASAPRDYDPVAVTNTALQAAFQAPSGVPHPLVASLGALGAISAEIRPIPAPDPAFPLFAAGRPVAMTVLTGAGPADGAALVPQADRGNMALLLANFAAGAASGGIHFIPYAYGALPLKSAGDVIGHGTHGLFGAVNVNPQSTELSGDVSRIELEGGTDLLPCEAGEVPNGCRDFVLVPGPDSKPWESRIVTRPEAGQEHRIRQFTLFWQDGLNLRDNGSADRFEGYLPPAMTQAVFPRLVANCQVCDDSYDWGEQGVNYRSASFARALRGTQGNGALAERHFNLNAFDFGAGVFRKDQPVPVLRAAAGEEVVIHLVHPGGRARQRAFITIGQDYNDLFPGFGFPHAALLAPGKSLTASLHEPMRKGCYLWHDGPTHLRAGGTWGLLDVVPEAEFGNADASSCP